MIGFLAKLPSFVFITTVCLSKANVILLMVLPVHFRLFLSVFTILHLTFDSAG